MIDDGRYPDGTCESCYSPLHGLWDCPEWLDSPIWVQHSRLRLRAKKTPAARGRLCVVDNRGTLKRDAKRAVRRARRRLEKLDPENAPTRLRELTWGWAD